MVNVTFYLFNNLNENEHQTENFQINSTLCIRILKSDNDSVKAFLHGSLVLFVLLSWIWFFPLLQSDLLLLLLYFDSAKLIDIYRTRHNISASTGLSDPAVATGISDLIYESKPSQSEPVDSLDDDLVNAWAANLGDDGLWGNNAPAMSRVRDGQSFLFSKFYFGRVRFSKFNLIRCAFLIV